MAKPKYNPEDVERWVTVRGARIPIMKDGSFSVGEQNSTGKNLQSSLDKLKSSYSKLEEQETEFDKFFNELQDLYAKKRNNKLTASDEKRIKFLLDKTDKLGSKLTSARKKYSKDVIASVQEGHTSWDDLSLDELATVKYGSEYARKPIKTYSKTAYVRFLEKRYLMIKKFLLRLKTQDMIPVGQRKRNNCVLTLSML